MDFKYSSKYLDFEALSLITNSDKSDYEYDGVILLTSYGTIIGNLKTDLQDNPDNPLVSKIISDLKQKIIKTMQETGNSKVDFIGDGSMITIENATVLVGGNNNNKLKFEQMTVFSDQVVSFAPINIDKILNQLFHKNH